MQEKLKKNLTFQPRARLLLQLGDELIRNESVAALELIKNSYDACASKVKLTMNDVDTVEGGTIVIEDDGSGMDLKIIEDVWMKPGSEHKHDMLKDKEVTKCKRTVLGEKGIGRFAVHKLGDHIELISRMKNKDEIHVKIDWTEFSKRKYLNEIPIEVSSTTPKHFTGTKTGTKIIVTKLRNPWTRQMLREVYRSFNSLRSPFSSPDSFDIEFNTNKEKWLDGLSSWKDVKTSSLFKFNCEIDGDRITKFTYRFTPWNTMDKLKPRTVNEKDKIKELFVMKNKKRLIDLSKFKIGKIKLEGYIFDRDPKVLDLGVQDKKLFKEYLDHNGGIKVFRDGVRVYDYGEPGNDWLNLDLRRVNAPTVRISNNIMITAVSIDRLSSADLQEKTNREGFIENEAFDEFKEAILYALSIVEQQRRTDKTKIRRLYGISPESEPVLKKIGLVKKAIDKKVKDPKVREELNGYMDTIQEDYKRIHNTLLRSAGAGLTLGVAIHEIEKIVEELKHIISSGFSNKQISTLVRHLSELVEGYTLTMRKTSMSEYNAWDLVEQGMFNFGLRLKAHGVTIVKGNVNKSKNLKIHCARSYIVGCMMNIFDNSLHWLDYYDIKPKKIFVSVHVDSPKSITLLIADNGHGFALPKSEITEPFVSAKRDGMGLGLHIVKEIMLIHKGKIHFPNWGEYEIPDEFKKGAIVALTFPRVQIK